MMTRASYERGYGGFLFCGATTNPFIGMILGTTA